MSTRASQTGRDYVSMSYTGMRRGLVLVGLALAAIGATLHVVINYHERAYAVFLLGMICILASVGIDFVKKRQQNTPMLAVTPSSLFILVGLVITAADLLLFRAQTHMKTTAIAAFGTALLLACVCSGLMIWQARHNQAARQRQ